MRREYVKITVLMSIYNEPIEWIKQSIDSIIKQTYKNFEFVIINDNPGREQNALLLNEYSIKDERIIIINNKENIGLTKSLNQGLEIAKGKYIARMDADDIALPNRLDIQYSFLEENKEYVLCGSSAIKINEKGEENGLICYPTDDSDIRNALILKNNFVHPSFFFRNDSSLKYNETIRYAQDYDFVINALSKGQVYNLKESLLYYRSSNQQIGTSKLKEQDAYANIIRQRYINELLRDVYKVNFNDENIISIVRKIFIKNKDIMISNIYFTLTVYLKRSYWYYRVLDFLFIPKPFVKKLQFLLSF